MAIGLFIPEPTEQEATMHGEYGYGLEDKLTRKLHLY